MRLLPVLIFPCVVMAGFSDVPESELYQYKEEKPVYKKAPTVRKSKKRLDDELLKKLMKEDRKIAELLYRQQKTVIVRKKDEKITALTRVKGVVLNSILAMNVKPSKFIVKLKGEHEEIEGAEIRCVGYSFEKRVPAHCDLLVAGGKEFQVDIDIWDLDGAEGIIADYYYLGEEKAFLTSSFASFLQGVLDVAKDRINTPFGQVTDNNAKNRVLNGIVGVASNVREKVAKSGEQNLSISYVNSGKEVLVFFNQSLLLNSEEGK